MTLDLSDALEVIKTVQLSDDNNENGSVDAGDVYTISVSAADHLH